MDWGRIRFFLNEVLRNFSRNLVMQVTAILTVAVMIMILGAFLYTRNTLTNVGTSVVNSIQISAYLNDRIATKDELALRTAIERDPRVRSVAFVAKAQGLRELRARLHGEVDTSLLTTNPLPDALRIQVVRPELAHAVAKSVKGRRGVANVVYAHDAVERLLIVSRILSRVGFIVVLLLVATAAIIISNTIRLTVIARRREISIMRLVGASSATIRWPFVFEGFIGGLLGAFLALGALILARAQLMPKLVSALPFMRIDAATSYDLTLALQLIVVGAVLGIVASWVSVGRYLRA